MVENFILIQLKFAELFVPQDFTIRTSPGLSGPANTCVIHCYHLREKKCNLLWVEKHKAKMHEHLNNIFNIQLVSCLT